MGGSMLAAAESGQIYQEGGSAGSIGAGNNDKSHTLSKGAAGTQRAIKMRINIPGCDDGTTVVFYDGIVGDAKPITGTLQLLAQPENGFELDGELITDEDKVIGMRIAGNTVTGLTAYWNVKYSY